MRCGRWGGAPHPWRFWLLALALAAACSDPAPDPIRIPTSPPARAPTPALTPTPAQSAAALFGEEPADVDYAFRIEVRDTIDQLHDLAGASCSGLAELVGGDPVAVPRLRAYAAFLKRVAANEPALATSSMKSLLEELEDAVRELDEQLARCSIRVG